MYHPKNQTSSPSVLLLYGSTIPRGVDPRSIILFVSDQEGADVVVDLHHIRFSRCPLFDSIVVNRLEKIDPTPLLKEGGKIYSLTPTAQDAKREKNILSDYFSFWKDRHYTLERLVETEGRVYGVWFA